MSALLEKFEPSTIARDASIAIVGKRRVGKSVLARELLGASPVVCAMWGTEEDGAYWQTLPACTAFSLGLDVDMLRSCLKKTSGCIVIDHVGLDKKMLPELAALVEHPSLGSIITYGFFGSMIPERTRYYFMFKNISDDDHSRFHRIRAHWISLNLFRNLYKEATAAAYGALVVDTVDRRFWSYTVKHVAPNAANLEARVAALEKIVFRAKGTDGPGRFEHPASGSCYTIGALPTELRP